MDYVPSHGSRQTPHSLIPRLLVALVDRVCRRPYLVLAASLLLGGYSLFAASRHLEYHTQRTDLISPEKDYQQRWRKHLVEFGDDDDMVLVVEGRNRERMQQCLESLAEKVRAHPDLFDRLFYKVDLRNLRNRALLFLPAESIRPIQESLKSMTLLLELGPWSWRSLGLVSLLREARHRAGQIDPDKPLSEADIQFLTQLVAVSRSASRTLINPDAYKTPWTSLMAQQPAQQDLLAEPQYFFSGNGNLAFLLVRPVKEEGSFTMAQKSVVKLRSLVAEVQPAFSDVEIGLTGLPVLDTDEMMAAERDTRLASWLAIAGVTLLFFAVYRGMFYPVMTMTTLLIGTAWAMGWLTGTVGHLNILSATFAVMLVGMGDYGVLWVMRYEAARRGGADVRSALLHTTTHVAVGNLTAASTLALAFFAAMLADFRAVGELGWIAGCGVLLCALACFTVLPSLMMIFDRRRIVGSGQWTVGSEKNNHDPAAPRILPFSSTVHCPLSTDQCWLPWMKRPGWVIAAGILLTAALGSAAAFIRYDHNLLHLQAQGLESVKWELKLINHTAGASWHALSCTTSPEEALALKAKYEQLPEVSRVVELASLVPREQPLKIEMLRDIEKRLAHLPARGKPIPHGKPSVREVKTELACLIGQLTPLTESGSQPLLVELRGNLLALQREIGAITETPTAEARLQCFDERLAGDLAEDLHKLHDVSTPELITVADLPADFRDRYIGQSGKWLLRVFAKDCLWDFEPLEHFTRQIQTVDPDATGKVFTTVEGLRAMKNGFERAGFYAFLAIIAVLVIDFRNVKLTLLALMPLAMGMAMTLGIMVLCKMPLNPANMIAFPLILGVGIDNGVHVLHDYLIRRRERLPNISYAIGRGVLVKAMTTMIGFGTLMISTQQGLVSLGFILMLGVGCCMVSALVFLPAVLRVVESRREAVLIREAVLVAEEPIPLRRAA